MGFKSYSSPGVYKQTKRNSGIWTNQSTLCPAFGRNTASSVGPRGWGEGTQMQILFTSQEERRRGYSDGTGNDSEQMSD